MVDALTATGIHAGYEDDVCVLTGVDLSVPAGRLISLIGPNAAGKSTLLRALAGLHSPTAGEVRLGDRALAELSTRERARHVAVIPQSLRALPDATVERFVRGGRYAHGRRRKADAHLDRSAVDDALTRAGCQGWRDRLLATLSGGERQRVLVARAVAQATPILLCDEPTAALDLDQQIAIYELLAELADEGKSVVTVTHDLNLASQFSDSVHLIHRGRMVAAGSPDCVLVPEVLTPVYGDNVHFGTLPGQPARPLVVAQRPSRPT